MDADPAAVRLVAVLDHTDLVEKNPVTKKYDVNEVFSYLDLGEDGEVGGEGVANMDSTRYVVEDSRKVDRVARQPHRRYRYRHRHYRHLPARGYHGSGGTR